MDAKIKQLWIDALRSGDYKQTRGALHKEDGFCCLGVLCDLHRKANPRKGWQNADKDSDNYPFNFYEYLGADTSLPMPVMKWAGLDAASPMVQYGLSKFTLLSTMNDSGATFTDIANVIEEHLR